MLCKALQDDVNDDGDDDKLGVCIIHDLHGSDGQGGTAPLYYYRLKRCTAQHQSIGTLVHWYSEQEHTTQHQLYWYSAQEYTA